ncbi:MAG: HlyD family secretion protein [Myxococcota bacterium]
MRRWLFPVVALSILLVVGAGVWWRNSLGVSTDDAFVRADVVQVAAEVSGRIVEVAVAENQHVSEGDLLYRVDRADYELKVAQAEANLAAAVADAKRSEESAAATRSDLRMGQVRLADAERELERQRQLASGGAGVQASVDRANTSKDVAAQGVRAASVGVSAAMAAVEAAQSRVPAAEAALALANRELANTEIRAPASGVASRADLQAGELVARGQPVLAIVPDDRYVVANFKETDLYEIHVGDPVDIDVDALSGDDLHGTVESIGAGTAATFSLLPADNASGNFVKVVQRVPVRISIQGEVPASLAAGLSTTVTVRPASR